MQFYGTLSILAAGFVLFGVYLFLHARRVGQASEGAWYSVGRRDMRRKALLVNLQAAALLLGGAGLLLWLLLELPEAAKREEEPAVPVPSLAPESPEAPLEPLLVEPTEVFTPTLRPALTATVVDESETPLVPIPTIPLTSQAIITRTDGGGLWLRDQPFGTGLILLPEGSTLFVRGGLMEVNGIMWQAVVDPDGREGWVAADYLIYR